MTVDSFIIACDFGFVQCLFVTFLYWFGFDDTITGPVDEILVIGALLFLGAIGVGWAEDAVDTIWQGVTSLTKSRYRADEGEKDITANPPKNDGYQTYYHATTYENAMVIMCSGIMKGSRSEGGHVFAWSRLPSKEAVLNSGARDTDVVIQFKTKSNFYKDATITDPVAISFGPLISTSSLGIIVCDVKIVANYRYR